MNGQINGESPHFTSIHWKDLSSLPNPSSWLLDEIIREGTISVLYGASGAGKGFVALDFAMKVAEQGKRVLFVACDDFDLINTRYHAWVNFHCNQGHYIKPLNRWACTKHQISLDHPKSIEDFIGAYKEFAPDLIIIDPLFQHMGGLDWYSGKDMSIAWHSLTTIRDGLNTTILVTVCGEKESLPVGLYAACHMAATATKHTNKIVVSCDKLRSGPPFESLYFTLEAYGDEAIMLPAALEVQRVMIRKIAIANKLQELLHRVGTAGCTLNNAPRYMRNVDIAELAESFEWLIARDVIRCEATKYFLIPPCDG